MKSLVASYTKLVDYQVADVTAASTFYIAEIYLNFSRSLMESERPEGLSDVELEEFDLMIEEQAFPFEEKAIQVHEKNMELLTVGVYSTWIDRSIEKLATLLPARYAKPEESINYISRIDNYIYSSPRYLREDASTGYIADLDFFRYTSQKALRSYHKNETKGDIGNHESVNQDNIGVEEPEHAPVTGQVTTQGSESKSNTLSESSTADSAKDARNMPNGSAGKNNVVEKQQSVGVSSSGKVQQQTNGSSPSLNTGSENVNDQVVEVDQETNSSQPQPQ